MPLIEAGWREIIHAFDIYTFCAVQTGDFLAGAKCLAIWVLTITHTATDFQRIVIYFYESRALSFDKSVLDSK